MTTAPDMSYPRYPVMLVDDEPHALDSLAILLRTEGINNAVKIADPRQVMPALASGRFSVILLDLIMPHIPGETLLADIMRDYPEVPVVVITGNNSLETAVHCMKRGAFDFMLKPVDADRVVTCIRHAIGLAELRDENRQLRDRIFAAGALAHPEIFAEIVTASPAMLAIFQYVEAIAGSGHPVLITGETGVGKELVARALHRAGGRPGCFLPVNVAGLDDQMFTDTLFGHIRGAFTGADRRRAGLIARARDGTLFLDEIGDLSSSSQLKLLRLLQESEYLAMGSDEIRHTNARIVVATNQDLSGAIAGGRFRKDLYYRLATHEIHVPPLRERREDVPRLVKHFLAQQARAAGQPAVTPPDDLLRRFQEYDFPGNVRELKSMLHDVVRRAAGGPAVTAMHPRLQAHMPADSAPADTHPPRMKLPDCLPTLREMDEILIAEALRRAGGRQTGAARLLGISQQALSRRLARRRRCDQSAPPPGAQ